MTEKIEERISRLIDAGIMIVTLDGSVKETSEDFSKNLGVKVESYGMELIGHFPNGCCEYVVGDRKAQAGDTGHPFVYSAERLAKKLDVLSKDWENFKMELHAIEDPTTNRAHYFVLPHRRYIKR